MSLTGAQDGDVQQGAFGPSSRIMAPPDGEPAPNSSTASPPAAAPPAPHEPGNSPERGEAFCQLQSSPKPRSPPSGLLSPSNDYHRRCPWAEGFAAPAGGLLDEAEQDMDSNGARLMTPRVLHWVCRTRGLYLTPACNTTLYLQDLKFRRIENLQEFVSCRVLHLSNNCLTRIEGLDHMTGLQALYLQSNDLRSLEGLSGLTALHTLHVSNNPLGRLEGLPPSLRTLHAANTGLTSAASLAGLSAQTVPQLEVLDLSGNTGLGASSAGGGTGVAGVRPDGVAATAAAGGGGGGGGSGGSSGREVVDALCGLRGSLRVLYLMKTPLQQISNLRRILVSALPCLSYLDTAPVDECDRRGCEAWLLGGVAAEKAARLAYRAERRLAQKRATVTFAVERARRRALREMVTAGNDAATLELMLEDTEDVVRRRLAPVAAAAAAAAVAGAGLALPGWPLGPSTAGCTALATLPREVVDLLPLARYTSSVAKAALRHEAETEMEAEAVEGVQEKEAEVEALEEEEDGEAAEVRAELEAEEAARVEAGAGVEMAEARAEVEAKERTQATGQGAQPSEQEDTGQGPGLGLGTSGDEWGRVGGQQQDQEEEEGERDDSATAPSDATSSAMSAANDTAVCAVADPGPDPGPGSDADAEERTASRQPVSAVGAPAAAAAAAAAAEGDAAPGPERPTVRWHVTGLSECVVCSEAFGEEEPVVLLPCHHFFHDRCIRRWLLGFSNSCPMCRSPVRPTGRAGGGGGQQSQSQSQSQSSAQGEAAAAAPAAAAAAAAAAAILMAAARPAAPDVSGVAADGGGGGGRRDVSCAESDVQEAAGRTGTEMPLPLLSHSCRAAGQGASPGGHGVEPQGQPPAPPAGDEVIGHGEGQEPKPDGIGGHASPEGPAAALQPPTAWVAALSTGQTQPWLLGGDPTPVVLETNLRSGGKRAEAAAAVGGVDAAAVEARVLQAGCKEGLGGVEGHAAAGHCAAAAGRERGVAAAAGNVDPCCSGGEGREDFGQGRGSGRGVADGPACNGGGSTAGCHTGTRLSAVGQQSSRGMQLPGPGLAMQGDAEWAGTWSPTVADPGANNRSAAPLPSPAPSDPPAAAQPSQASARPVPAPSPMPAPTAASVRRDPSVAGLSQPDSVPPFTELQRPSTTAVSASAGKGSTATPSGALATAAPVEGISLATAAASDAPGGQSPYVARYNYRAPLPLPRGDPDEYEEGCWELPGGTPVAAVPYL